MEYAEIRSSATIVENPYKGPAKLFVEGMVNAYQPPLAGVQKQLNELVEQQENLLSKIHLEYASILDIQGSPDLQDMFNKMKTYNSKLQDIKKDMRILHEQGAKLRKRAAKLQLDQ
ncbi:uncharacterized protein LOC132708141 [Cylas formicarius]|uniref:uncharacterized protein LOC132708141 n=1 Tax=Cylas formicarius TaxID=197179 RepID=UPI002958AA11|nr:uncharacterized protein LOC132708141 [Cylas formicarius]